MFKDKKGFEKSVVVAIALLVAAGILFIGYNAIAKTGQNMVDREACKNSVLLKERSKLLGQPLIGDLNCETHLVEINSRDETEIKRIIADEMYDCWYQFGQGERDFLGDTDPWKGDNYCFVCSRIEFDKGTQKEISQINNFMSYLSTEPLPLHNQETFFDYIYGKGTYGLSEINETTLSTSVPLYVVFFADKRIDAWDNAGQQTKVALASTIFGAIGGCVLGGFGGTLVAPVAGTIAGCVAGAKAGIGVGLVVAGGNAAVTSVARKTGYYPALYVGNDEKIIEWCQQ